MNTNTEDILDKIRNLPVSKRRKLSYEELKEMLPKLSCDEISEMSRLIGYPVFTRLCMGEIGHQFVLLQDGAAAIIVNGKGQILLQKRRDNDKWGLPGGCQEVGESFSEVIIREVKEETNLEVDHLQLIDVTSGMSRKNVYPNGDIVINNTVLYYIDQYHGELKWDEESKELRFFDLEQLPAVDKQNDPDLINVYKKWRENDEIKR